MLLDIVLNCNLPTVGVAKVHDHLVVHGKGICLGLTMVETSPLLCSTGCCEPIHHGDGLLVAMVKGFQ